MNIDIPQNILGKLISLYDQENYQACLDAYNKFEQEDCGIIKDNKLYAKIFQLIAQAAALLGENELALTYYRKYQLYNIQFSNKYLELGDLIVYSFRNVNKYTLSDLNNNVITLAPPNKMNDPLDSLYLLWVENFSNLYEEKNIEKPVYLQLLKESFKNYRIRSFVANQIATSDDRIIQNMLMWSHYAGEHTGYCIKYRLSKYFIKHFDKEREYTHFMKDVDCTKETKIDITQETIDTETAFFIKHPLWQYENELRLLSYDAKNENEFPNIPLDEKSKIEAIYFGCRCSEQDKKLIKSIARNGSNNHIHFYKMEYNMRDIYNFQIIDY